MVVVARESSLDFFGGAHFQKTSSVVVWAGTVLRELHLCKPSYELSKIYANVSISGQVRVQLEFRCLDGS